MTIKFLQDYTVGTPPEVFEAGQVVEDRGDASEAHFVRRGVAAYIDGEGVLRDIDGGVVFERPPLPVDSETAPGLGDKAPSRASRRAEKLAAADTAPPADMVLSGADIKSAEASDAD